MRLGIVIVTYNSAAHIGACLDACLSLRAELPLEIIVVDNASRDATAAEVRLRPTVRFVQNEENRGFAAAVNQGFRALDTELVLLLNPDAEPLSGLAALCRAFVDPVVGAAAGRLLDSDGNPQLGFQIRRFPTALALACESLGLNRIWASNPVNRSYRALDLDPDLPADVDQPAGAFLLVRHAAWRAVNGFDEGFFPIWFEDVDFCLRLREAGYRIRYVPQASAVHAGGHSLASISWTRRQLCWYGSLLRYAARHCRPAGRCLVCWAVMFGAVARALMGIVRERSLQPLFVYGSVLRLAGVCLFRGTVPPTGAASGDRPDRAGTGWQ
jgi:N-acetylglucosaminyl-diphospho-decaprenol L-rhamnosyltransferase